MRAERLDDVLTANIRVGLLVFMQPAGRKSQPLVEFCLLFIREVYIPCEAFEFIFDRLTLFIAKTHRFTPFCTGNLILAPVRHPAALSTLESQMAGKTKSHGQTHL